MSEGEGFACHNTLGTEDDDDATPSLCVGALRYSLKTGKLYRNLALSIAQQGQKNEDRNNILSMGEFLVHHKDATLL